MMDNTTLDLAQSSKSYAVMIPDFFFFCISNSIAFAFCIETCRSEVSVSLGQPHPQLSSHLRLSGNKMTTTASYVCPIATRGT